MKGHFLGFVLLSNSVWNAETFPQQLAERWQIPCKDVQYKGDIVVFDCGGFMVSAALVPAPVPNGEAEQCAQFNFMWRDAVKNTSMHRAHIVLSVTGGGPEAGAVFVRAAETILSGRNVIGLYTNGTVYEPAYYCKTAQIIRDGMLPVYNLVWYGMAREEDGTFRGYTMGLEQFDKTELEVRHVNDKPTNLLTFMAQIAGYVIESDVTLHDGETIGFTADQRLRISLRDSVEFEGEKTLHIEYPQN